MRPSSQRLAGGHSRPDWNHLGRAFGVSLPLFTSKRMNIGNQLARLRLFIGAVVVPSLLAAVYYGVIASDVYVSESRFVVRSAQKPDGGAAISELFKGFAVTGSENVLLVRDYLLASEVMQAIDGRFNLREKYGEGDFVSRFPAMWQRSSLEEFASYYKDHVRLDVDANSAVGVLTVSAFEAKSAFEINSALLKQAETRVVSLNSKIRKDTWEVADRELARAQTRLAQADAALAQYRQKRGLLDPERQAALELQGEQELNAKLVGARARLEQARRLAPLSPQVTSLESEVGTLELAAAQVRAKVAGAGRESRVSSAQDFQALQLEREMASKNVAAAYEALLRARIDVERQHLYIETVSMPSLPDSALQPRRARSIAAVFLLCLAVFAVLSLVRAGMHEHGQSV